MSSGGGGMGSSTPVPVLLLLLTSPPPPLLLTPAVEPRCASESVEAGPALTERVCVRCTAREKRSSSGRVPLRAGRWIDSNRIPSRSTLMWRGVGSALQSVCEGVRVIERVKPEQVTVRSSSKQSSSGPMHSQRRCGESTGTGSLHPGAAALSGNWGPGIHGVSTRRKCRRCEGIDAAATAAAAAAAESSVGIGGGSHGGSLHAYAAVPRAGSKLTSLVPAWPKAKARGVWLIRWLTAWTVAGGGDLDTRRTTSPPAALETADGGLLLWATEVGGAAEDVEGASLPLRLRSREFRNVPPSAGAEAERSRTAAAEGAAVLPAGCSAKPPEAAAAPAAEAAEEAGGGDGFERNPHAMRTHASCTAEGLM